MSHFNEDDSVITDIYVHPATLDWLAPMLTAEMPNHISRATGHKLRCVTDDSYSDVPTHGLYEIGVPYIYLLGSFDNYIISDGDNGSFGLDGKDFMAFLENGTLPPLEGEGKQAFDRWNTAFSHLDALTWLVNQPDPLKAFNRDNNVDYNNLSLIILLSHSNPNTPIAHKTLGTKSLSEHFDNFVRPYKGTLSQQGRAVLEKVILGPGSHLDPTWHLEDIFQVKEALSKSTVTTTMKPS